MLSDIGLRLEQTQKLIMTPELRQAIVVLQLSTLELTNYIQQELQENPVLEIKEESDPVSVEEAPEENDLFDIDWQEYFQDGSDLGYVKVPAKERYDWIRENTITGQVSLRDHLLVQLKIAPLTKRQIEIGSYLIGNLDRNGYLCISLKEAAKHLKAGIAEVWHVLEYIQHFDPPGVGARNLEECLLLQVAQNDCPPPGTESIIRSYLPEVAAGRINNIARKLNLNIQDVQRAVDYIRTLDPKPGRSFSDGQENRYILPDIVIERVDGEYVVLVNDITIPRLSLNHTYQVLIRQGTCDDETRRFIENKLNAAAWLIRSLEQRRLTIYRVVNCLVKEQREFLDKGIRFLKPLTMQKVASALGIHESTVSRAVANKYVQTPQGVLPLKFFFASGVNDNRSIATAESVKRIIAEIINNEDTARPLSDRQVQEILQGQGINISRRTVAKYRDDLNIPAAARRKRY